MWFSLCLSVILLRSVSCVFYNKDWIGLDKIIFGLVRIDREAFFELRTNCTRGLPYKLLNTTVESLVRSNFFVERVINAWNGLPVDRIDFRSYPFPSSLQHCVLTAS